MGAIVSVRPPDPKHGRAVWGWIIMFGVVGAIVTGAQVWSAAQDREERKQELTELRKELTGEENFAYFEVRPPIANCDNVYIRMVQAGFVRDVAIGWFSKNEAGDYIDLNTWGGQLHTLVGETVDQQQSIGLGNYQIAFRSPNNDWDQYLDLNCTNNELTERIEIKRNEESIFQGEKHRSYKVEGTSNVSGETPKP